MAHSLFCSCKKCNPSLFDALFKPTPKKGPFYNSGKSGSKSGSSRNYGPGHSYYGGKGKPDGPGHGHRNSTNGFDRPPVKDFLGNTAIRRSGGRMGDRNSTPRTWKNT